MFILGLLKEQRQEEVYRERINQEWIFKIILNLAFNKYQLQISEESLGCVSDEKCLKMFEN